MKNTLLALFLSITLFSCTGGSLEKTLTSKAFTDKDDFNEFPKYKDKILVVEDVYDKNPDSSGGFAVKLKDTALYIQDGSKPLAKKYQDARFINSQKTAVLVQIEDGAKKISPFYIITLQNGLPNAVALTLPSNGAKDKDFAKGLEEITRTTVVVNNDFVVATVRGKVYPIKRQNPAEMIQGKFILYSSDKSTLVFAVDKGLYQVNYLTGETLTLPVPPKVLNSETMVREIQQNYSWEKNSRGTSFLKENPDDDRIVDIKEFKH
ncbi:copper amine oxidase N-terminal domain-containing protein [Pedobacter sp. Leaf250]|uniref:copper amine oxidase N-terminal domain-containing protein n=1 Tax=Pedobacter sp. Leaf250 TaxID=2876559 RepID=UPI001E628410|nr:copper amine oxidase N-terminal domain-containing protein [Pedobacter sp. Leaf250]